MKIILVILLMLMSHFDPNEDFKLWVRLDFKINSRKIVNSDSINYYFSFYEKGERVILVNNKPIDILTIDSIVIQYNGLIFNSGKYIDYIKYKNFNEFIKFNEGDTLDFDCFFYTDFKKSLGYNGTLPDSLKFYGLILDNIYICKEYR
jgi:hypothetical protein